MSVCNSLILLADVMAMQKATFIERWDIENVASVSMGGLVKY